MLSTYRKALALLSRKEKRGGGLVLGMVIVMAVLETAGVASVMPFLSVLGNPEVVQTNPVLNTVYEGLGFTSVDAFILALGAAAFGLILFSAFFRSLTHYAMNRFIEMRRHSIGKRLLETAEDSHMEPRPAVARLLVILGRPPGSVGDSECPAGGHVRK